MDDRLKTRTPSLPPRNYHYAKNTENSKVNINSQVKERVKREVEHEKEAMYSNLATGKGLNQQVCDYLWYSW